MISSRCSTLTRIIIVFFVLYTSSIRSWLINTLICDACSYNVFNNGCWGVLFVIPCYGDWLQEEWSGRTDSIETRLFSFSLIYKIILLWQSSTGGKRNAVLLLVPLVCRNHMQMILLCLRDNTGDTKKA